MVSKEVKRLVTSHYVTERKCGTFGRTNLFTDDVIRMLALLALSLWCKPRKFCDKTRLLGNESWQFVKLKAAGVSC